MVAKPKYSVVVDPISGETSPHSAKDFGMLRLRKQLSHSPRGPRGLADRMYVLSLTALGATLLSGCVATDSARPGYLYIQYDHTHPDPAFGDYDAGRYYSNNPKYREHRLQRNDRVYRSNDGRYYCRRKDGTTGLILGAIAGGILGNIIAPGDSQTLGTLLGAGGGAAIGRSIGRNGARCR
jgi:Glycine zipper 2TM domain